MAYKQKRWYWSLLIITPLFMVPDARAGGDDWSCRDELLKQRAGFGCNVTGGYSGPVVHVGTNADSGDGSLREALTGSDPRWIIFDGNYTILLNRGIEVGSNKTIDGRGCRVTLTGHDQSGLKTGLQILLLKI